MLPKTAGSAQTHKSISFIWIVWSTLYVYLWKYCGFLHSFISTESINRDHATLIGSRLPQLWKFCHITLHLEASQYDMSNLKYGKLWKVAGLALLFSRQILFGCRIFISCAAQMRQNGEKQNVTKGFQPSKNIMVTQLVKMSFFIIPIAIFYIKRTETF